MLAEDYISSAVPLDDWNHFDEFEISAKREETGLGPGAHTCNPENGDLPALESFGTSKEACFVSTEILTVDGDDAQTGNTGIDSTINTTKHLISVKCKSLLSEGEHKSIASGTEPSDETEGSSTGQCVSIHRGLGFFHVCLSVFLYVIIIIILYIFQ